MDPRSQTASVDDLLAHVGWVQALARSLVADSSTADDLAQETWMAALTGARATNESPRGWLGRVLRNRMLQRARSERARSDHERSERPEPDLPSSDDLLERIEQQKLLADVLVGLREPYRESVILRYYEGLNATEIGERLGVSSGTIRQRLKRGLEALREDLDSRVEGGREAWLSALLPLVEFGRSGSIPFDPSVVGAGTALTGAIVMKKIAILVCAVLLAGTTAYFWESEEPELSRLDSHAESSLLSSPSRAEASARQGEGALRSEDLPRGLGASRIALEGKRDEAQASLTGRVVSPDSLRVFDETLEVFALSEPTDYVDFVQAHDATLGKELLAKTTVGEGGEFSFRFDREPALVHLMVRGRHMYLDETVEVVLGGSPMIVLTPRCGAWVHGSVRAPLDLRESDPSLVAGTRVQLINANVFGQESGKRVVYTCKADGAGRYEVRAVAPATGSKLFATSDNFAARLVALDELTECAEVERDLDLVRGGVVSGRVLTETGEAIPGAELRAIMPGDYLGFDDHRVGKTVSGKDGSFALNHLPPGKIFLAAFQTGFLDSEKLDVHVLNREELMGVTLVLPRGSSISGHVLREDGTPVGHAEVRVSFDQSFQVGISAFNALRGAKGSAQSGPDGSFQISGLGLGPFVVQASLEDGAQELSARADAVQPDTADLQLVARVPLELRGMVNSEVGLPIPNFRVTAVRIVDGAIGKTATNEQSGEFEDPAGSFTLGELIAGSWRVDVEAEGFANAESQTIELPTREALQFLLSVPGTIDGVVLDPDGVALADAQVFVDSGESKWEAQFASSRGGPTTRSDDRGRFTLSGVRPGEVAIRALAAGFAKSDASMVELEAGKKVNGVALQLKRGGRITGEIFEEGKPAEGRVITLVQWERGNFDTSLAESDSNGRFEFAHVDPGNWNVVAMDLKADWSSTDKGDSMTQRMSSMKSAQVTVKEGTENHVVLGALPRSPIQLSGRVTVGDEPFVGAMVILKSIEAGSTAEAKMTGVDEKGGYRMTLDGPGAYQLSVNRIGSSAGEVSVFAFVHDIEDKPEVLIDVTIPGGGIEGAVTDKEGGALANVGVTLAPGMGASAEQVFAHRYIMTTTDANGRFELPNLAPGNYQLATMPHGHLAGAKLDGIELGQDQWLRDVQIQSVPAGAVDVRVTDNLGRVCANAAIFARDSSGGLVSAVATAKSDADGIARYEGLAPGAYSFFARSVEFVSAVEVAVEVREGENAAVRLPVELGAFLIVTAKDGRELMSVSFLVEDADGRDVSNLFNTAFDAQEHFVTGLSGQRRIGPLPAGTYRVTALTRSGSSAKKSVTLRAGGERKLTLRL